MRLVMVVSAATLADLGATALPLAAAVPTIAIAFAFSFCFASACFAAVFATNFPTFIFSHRCLDPLRDRGLNIACLHRSDVNRVMDGEANKCLLAVRVGDLVADLFCC